MSTFKYCPLMWDFCGKIENKAINKINKRTLRLIYDIEDATFEVKIYQKGTNREVFIKIIYTNYQSIHHIIPAIMRNFFDFKRTRYYLRGNYFLKLTDTSTCRYSTEALCFKGSPLWNKAPNKYTNLNSLEEFKSQIKQWDPTTCSYKTCK